jgi:hypothetical protein
LFVRWHVAPAVSVRPPQRQQVGCTIATPPCMPAHCSDASCHAASAGLAHCCEHNLVLLPLPCPHNLVQHLILNGWHVWVCMWTGTAIAGPYVWARLACGSFDAAGPWRFDFPAPQRTGQGPHLMCGCRSAVCLGWVYIVVVRSVTWSLERRLGRLPSRGLAGGRGPGLYSHAWP